MSCEVTWACFADGWWGMHACIQCSIPFHFTSFITMVDRWHDRWSTRRPIPHTQQQRHCCVARQAKIRHIAAYYEVLNTVRVYRLIGTADDSFPNNNNIYNTKTNKTQRTNTRTNTIGLDQRKCDIVLNNKHNSLFTTIASHRVASHQY